MKGKHFAHRIKNSKRTKSIVLSIVALLELLLLLTSVTFSWFEGLSSLELVGENFKTASVFKSHIELGENSSSSDTTYNQVIDLTEFFDTQNMVRLSPVSSSDAVNFYAAYEGEAGKAGAKYRKLTKEDVNSNIIQFQFNIESANGLTDLYLTELMPIVKIDGTARNYASNYSYPYRFAFSDGENTYILKNSNTLDINDSTTPKKQPYIVSLNTDDTAVTSSGRVERVQEYTYYTDHRNKVLTPTSDGNGEEVPISPLFRLQEGERKTITVSVWLEAFDYECTADTSYKPKPNSTVSFDIKLCTTWSISREITVYDYTADQNINTLYIRNQSGNNKYQLTKTDGVWKGKIPLALDKCEFVYKTTGSSTEIVTSASDRGDSTTLTILGKNGCVWNLLPENLIKIDFRDYTDGSWVSNNDDMGNPIDISVKYTYEGKELEYDMTNLPTTDKMGKNSWSCWIPNTVDDINFYRSGYKSANNYKKFNYWEGTDRGTNTVYRATGTTGNSSSEIDTSKIIYVSIPSNSPAYSEFTQGKPYISFTAESNYNVWKAKASTGSYSQIDCSNYHPNEDKWNGIGAMEAVIGETNLWYYVLEDKPADGDTYTIFTESVHEFNNVRQNMSFGVFEYTGKGNTILIDNKVKLTAGDPRDNYALLGNFNTSNDLVNNGQTDIELGIGTWGELKAPTPGTYDATFIHRSDVEYVKVTYTYEGNVYTFDMTKGADGLTWTTRAIPNAVTTGITFTDSKGNTWTNTGTKSSTKKFFYAISENGASSTGSGWRAKINLSGSTSYFKHYDSSVTKLTATFTYNSIPFTVSLTKGTDNVTWNTTQIPNTVTAVEYSDGTNKWNMTGKGTTNPYCFALSKYVAAFGQATSERIYFTNNYSWSDIRIHYFGGSTSSVWETRPNMTYVATNNLNQSVYAYLVTPGTTGIVLSGNDTSGNFKHSVDITSNVNDMKGFYFTGWSGSKTTATSWNVDAAFLNQYSKK